ncbi:MAG: Site-specific DNA-methyltransferase (Adenine-specific) [Candidatus Daviesbacteria bacterium GW2011_GWA2_38_24]|uniref:Site-specific DNA-methyltransferase (Adenine-specific) n=1 Tax=Candidatus Daviesbacteria bacterium GW2011_GWA2_38_24 TaxID=1618422 RepID=A0A0G0J9U2_9BACT|nr:MAG: Site-specific DNA-methyltransferase (Adenine-specific) [Candidatus Daviesbacteria bacterium GW2011_GWA2_38_24]
MWLGNGFHAGNAYFSTPLAKEYGEGVYMPETGLVKFRNVCWFTNLDHGRRHQPLPLMTMKENLKYSKHKEIKGKKSYDKYDNYSAIEVSFTDAIPSDYDGIMGVPISFLDKYNPDQFEIIGMAEDNGKGFSGGIWDGKNPHCVINGENKFKRIFIKHKKNKQNNYGK